MKIRSYVCAVVCFCSASMADDYQTDTPTVYSGDASNELTPMDPTQFVTISQNAMDEAAAPSCGYMIFGVGIGTQTYEASVDRDEPAEPALGFIPIPKEHYFTKNQIRIPSVIVGGGYFNTLSNNIVVGYDAVAQISRKKKKEGTWDGMNLAHTQVVQRLSVGGSLSEEQLEHLGGEKARLVSNMIVPTGGLKGGYWFKGLKTIIYGKVGVSMLSGTYYYYSNNQKMFDVKANVFVPTLAFGAEVRFSKKYGIIAEYSFTKKRTVTKSVMQIDHKFILNRNDIRIMLTYAIN